MTDQKVPNPERQRLKDLKIQFEKERADLVGVFKRAETTIGDGGKDSGKAWVGKNADKWLDDVRGRRRQVKKLLGQAIDDIQKKINSMPEQVTQAEANMMNKMNAMPS